MSGKTKRRDMFPAWEYPFRVVWKDETLTVKSQVFMEYGYAVAHAINYAQAGYIDVIILPRMSGKSRYRFDNNSRVWRRKRRNKNSYIVVDIKHSVPVESISQGIHI